MASRISGFSIRRKLAAFTAAFAAACFIAQYIIPMDWLLVIAAISVIISVCAFLYDRKYKAGLCIIAIGLTVGFLWSFAFRRIYFVPAELFNGRTEKIYAVAADYSNVTDYGISIDAKIIPETGAAIKSIIYLNEKELSVKPGDKITMYARLKLSTEVYDSGFTYFSSKGIFLLAYPTGPAKIETGPMPFHYFPATISNEMTERILLIFKPEIVPFMKGVLTGDRSEFSDYLTSSLNDSGLSHIVVVSGMHLAFLVGMINTLARNKKRTSIIAIPVILIFMAVMGFTPSVTRAGVMQIIMLLAPLLKRESDPPTSLAFALALILIVNPFAAASVSLQLSFASVAGIMLFAGKMNDVICTLFERLENRIITAALRFIAASISTTFGAMIFTQPLICAYFGRVTLVAPVSNLLTLWAVSLVFSAGMIAVILSFIYMPLSIILGKALVPFCEYIIWTAHKIAAVPIVLNTLNKYFLAWFLYAYLIIWIWILGKKQKFAAILSAGLVICSLGVAFLLSAMEFRRYAATVAVLDVGQGQSVVITAGKYTVLIDCGGNKKNAGDIAADYIRSLNRHTIDLVILSHYHSDHSNGIPELFNRMEIKSIALPNIDEDMDMRLELIELADENGTEVIDVYSDMNITLGNAGVYLYTSDFTYLTNEKGIVTLFSSDNFETLMTGDINDISERRLLNRIDLPEIELLVAGHHGSRNSTSDELLDSIRTKAAVISTGKNNYGHPAPETLERLENRRIKIYRTDERGTITVKVGGGG